MRQNNNIVIIGAGIFGITAALALNKRGQAVVVLDPGPLPHPLAASTDISKVIRMEYGADEAYMTIMEQARQGWLDWNQAWPEPLYHETGVLMLARQPMAPGSFEHESYQMLIKHNHTPERLSSDDIMRRFPAWKPGAFVDGFYHAKGGYAESGRVVEALIAEAQQRGILLHAGQTAETFLEENGRVYAVQTREGQTFTGTHFVVAAGAWTPFLVPELMPAFKATGHPVFHLKTAESTLFTPPHFPVFTADISNSGWYGFPLHPGQGVIKIANHGVGQQLHPSHSQRVVTDTDIRQLRNFLADTFPALQEATITYTRRCLYADTQDEHFWIANHPQKRGLTIASGGSGHGFKFAPILGDLIADAVEGIANPWLPKFQWRTFSQDTDGQEASRFHG